jgi:YidC/Oxa1 family membrane protein insertase
LERRYALFIALSLAIVVGSQLLQAYLFPKPQPDPAAAADAQARQAENDQPAIRGDDRGADRQADRGKNEPAIPAGDEAGDDQPAEADLAADATQAAEAGADEPAERRRFTLGSLAEEDPAGMLVTLTSRGAAVERIELAGRRFHDQENRGAYLGELALEPVAEGLRVGLAGPGTPAAAAGLEPGDVILRAAGVAIADSEGLAALLAEKRPGDTLELEVSRDGQPRSIVPTLGWRPLSVVRPEWRTQPVADPDAGRLDPLSFVLSLERRITASGERRRDEPLEEIRGLELAEVDWTAEPLEEGGVRFSRGLGGGLRLVKEFRLAVEDDGSPRPYALELLLTLEATAGKQTVVYALDGPTGLPTEGWWYTARISRDWGSLGVRDAAMRFDGESSRVVSSVGLVDEPGEVAGSAVLEGKPLSFAGVDALYFTSAVLPAAEGPLAPSLEEVRPLLVGEVPADRRKLANVTARMISRPIELTPGEPVQHRYEIFAGPKKPDVLDRFGRPAATMADLVYYGWFGWVAKPLIAVLHALHAVVQNYGIAIILLTVIVRGAMFPVSRKQALSAQKMQVLQPEMKAIAEKYKNDAEKRTRATQELWRKHNYNPASGCLLVFIQIPIFMGLYRSLATDVELRQAPLFSSWIRWCSNLAAPDMLYDWSNLLPTFLTSPDGWLGPYLNLFPLLTIGLFLWQQKLFMPPAVDEQAKVQQQVMKYMMFFMAFMFFKVPCGLCLYFIASSLWGIAERIWLPVPKLAGAAVGAGTRTIDVPFSSNGGSGSGKAGKSLATAARDRREARKKKGR